MRSFLRVLLGLTPVFDEKRVGRPFGQPLLDAASLRSPRGQAA